MFDEKIEKLYKILDVLESSGKNINEINQIKDLLDNGEIEEAIKKMKKISKNDSDNEEFEEENNDQYEDSTIYETEENKKQESLYPQKLLDSQLEETYIGLLLNNPKLIAKYYILFDECYFEDESLLNIYKSVLFTEGGRYTPEIAKQGFNFASVNDAMYNQKQELKEKINEKEYNPEKIYTELKKLFILRKSYLEEPRGDIQNQIIDIKNYELYDQMSEEEVKSAINQVSVTQKFKQAILSEDLTQFLERGENNLTNGLELPFPILSSVFKGIRKGKTN